MTIYQTLRRLCKQRGLCTNCIKRSARPGKCECEKCANRRAELKFGKSQKRTYNIRNLSHTIDFSRPSAELAQEVGVTRQAIEYWKKKLKA